MNSPWFLKVIYMLSEGFLICNLLWDLLCDRFWETRGSLLVLKFNIITIIIDGEGFKNIQQLWI